MNGLSGLVEKLSPPNGATRRLLKPPGQRERRGGAMLKDLNNPLLRDAAVICEPLTGPTLKAGIEVHKDMVNPSFTMSSPRDGLRDVYQVQTMDMDRWPQRELFKIRLKGWRDRQGISMVQAAEALGVTYDTLRQYLYRADTKPSLAFIQRAVTVTGGSVSDYIDDPGNAPEGTEDSDEMTRFMARAMGSDLAKLTPEQKQAAFEVWRATIRGFLGK